MKRLVLLFGNIGLGLALTTQAQVRVALPVGGAGPGQSLLLPVRIEPSTNLAGVQCDILFDASKLACDGAQFVAGTPGVVVDGANALPGNPGLFRLLAYAPLGTPLTNGVTCALAFRVLPVAASGEVPLTAETNFVYGSSTLATIASNQPTSGMVVIGDAFLHGDVVAMRSSGALCQFRTTNAPSGATCVTLASTNLITWQAVATNTVVDGVVYSFDPDARLFPHRFYRITPQKGHGVAFRTASVQRREVSFWALAALHASTNCLRDWGVFSPSSCAVLIPKWRELPCALHISRQ